MNQPDLYSRNNELQLKDGREFLTLVGEILKWTFLSTHVFLDIGTGTGDNCPQVLISRFPEIQKIIGIDSSKEMIDFAKKTNRNEKIEFLVLDFENGSFPNEWRGNISNIVSIHCIHWLKDHKKVFQKIYEILKPGGEAALLFGLSTREWNGVLALMKNPKWKNIFQNVDPHIPESHYKKLSSSFYESLLREIGFEIILCVAEDVTYQFPSKERYLDFLTAACGLTSHVPPSLMNEYKKDLYNECKKYSGDHFIFKYKPIKIIIRKPFSK